MSYKRLFLTGLYLGLASVSLSGCSLVQWLPSSACEHVMYERTGNSVEVYAQCQV
jgi:hypothetical protein